MLPTRHFFCCSVVAILCNGMAVVLLPAAQPTVEQAMNLTPIQEDVGFDKPSAGEVARCTMRSEKSGRAASS